jgi:leader peptidase (prepilin peptidase)/N-methyltransferase
VRRARGPRAAADRHYNLFTPPSACPSCGTPIKAIHNIPVVSWLALRGKCAQVRGAHQRALSAVEVLGGIVAC